MSTAKLPGLFILMVTGLIATTAVMANVRLTPDKAKIYLNELQKATVGLKTLEANVEQRRVLTLFSDDLKSKAKLYVELPASVRWETLAPYRSAIIFRNGNAAKFERLDGAWKKINFGGADILAHIMGDILRWNQGDFSSTEEDYTVAVFSDNMVTLEPKSSSLKKALNMIELHFDPKSLRLRKTILREARGDYVELVFSAVKENTILASMLFDLEKPR